IEDNAEVSQPLTDEEIHAQALETLLAMHPEGGDPMPPELLQNSEVTTAAAAVMIEDNTEVSQPLTDEEIHAQALETLLALHPEGGDPMPPELQYNFIDAFEETLAIHPEGGDFLNEASTFTLPIEPNIITTTSDGVIDLGDEFILTFTEDNLVGFDGGDLVQSLANDDVIGLGDEFILTNYAGDFLGLPDDDISAAWDSVSSQLPSQGQQIIETAHELFGNADPDFLAGAVNDFLDQNGIAIDELISSDDDALEIVTAEGATLDLYADMGAMSATPGDANGVLDSIEEAPAHEFDDTAALMEANANVI
ncbi:MAG: hypothetical protein AAF226_09180, partial [Verrucomicrobiota bacterium]